MRRRQAALLARARKAPRDRTLGFDALLLATGAIPRRPAFAPENESVGCLRTLADGERVRSALRPGQRMAILGGGWLGREVAGAARAAGHPRLGGHVHVVVAGMHVNDWDATKPIRAVVAAGSVDVRRLRVPRVPLGEMVGG